MRNKITVDLDPTTAKFVESLKAKYGTPYSYTIRKALNMYETYLTAVNTPTNNQKSFQEYMEDLNEV